MKSPFFLRIFIILFFFFSLFIPFYPASLRSTWLPTEFNRKKSSFWLSRNLNSPILQFILTLIRSNVNRHRYTFLFQFPRSINFPLPGYRYYTPSKFVQRAQLAAMYQRRIGIEAKRHYLWGDEIRLREIFNTRNDPLYPRNS